MYKSTAQSTLQKNITTKMDGDLDFLLLIYLIIYFNDSINSVCLDHLTSALENNWTQGSLYEPGVE